MKIALFQSDIEWCNKEKNFAVAREKVKEAKNKGCSVIFFPEMSFTGFSMATEVTAESDTKTLDFVTSLAKEYSIYIGFGYVKKVNGITADYDADQTYWAFYVNGEYATAGVDSTTIEEGATYSFKVEK